MAELVELYAGARHRICYIRGSKADVDTALADLREDERRKVLALITHVADYGPPRNPQKCRSLVSEKGLFELKSGRVRIPFFYWHGQIVLTHVFFKKGEKTPQSEVTYAAQLRAQIEGR